MSTTHSLFHSFCARNNYESEARSDEEKALLIVRAHPITTLSWLLLGVLFAFIPFFFADFLGDLPLKQNQQLFIIIFWYALIYSYLLNKFYFWYFNLGVVTNQKIVDIDANNLLNTQTAATIINKVEEVNKKSLGLVGSFFDYGDIYVETAGENPNVEFLKVPHPSEIVKIINNNMRAHGSKRTN